MKKRFIIIPALMLILVLTIGKLPQPSSAIIRWTEDFEGGLGGWTIVEGGFVIENGRVSGTNREVNVMRHESTTAYGYWSFDVYFIRTDYHLTWSVFFVSSEDSLWDRPRNGYELGGDDDDYRLQSFTDFIPQEQDGYSFDNISDQIHIMMHFDIVRRYDGYLYAWANYSTNHIFFDTYENSHTSSAYLDIVIDHHLQVWIDNIRVDDNPDNGPPPGEPDIPMPPPPNLLLVTPWAIGLCLVVGGLIVWRRRQKKVDITPGEELRD